MEATEGKRSALVPVAGCGCAAVIGLFAIGALVGITSPFMSGGSTYVPTAHTPNEGVPLGQPTAPSILSPPRQAVSDTTPGAVTLWDGPAHSLRVVDGPPRSSCTITLTRHERGGSAPWCRSRVECDGQLLRGSDSAGYFECTFGSGFPAGEDGNINDVDSSFHISPDGTFFIGDRERGARAPYYIEGNLGPWVAPTLSIEILDQTGALSSFTEAELAGFVENTCNSDGAVGSAELIASTTATSTGVRRISCVGMSIATCECLEAELTNAIPSTVELGILEVKVTYSRGF